MRAVAKNKSAKFSEVVASAAATKGREKDALCNYVTKARLSNVLSKVRKDQESKRCQIDGTFEKRHAGRHCGGGQGRRRIAQHLFGKERGRGESSFEAQS